MRRTSNIRGIRAAVAAAVMAATMALPTPISAADPAVVYVPPSGPLPACRIDDVLTRFTDPRDWQITLLDTSHRVTSSYRPPRLVSTAKAGIKGGERVRPEVIPDLRLMWKASRNAGAELAVTSGHRSYREQIGVFAQWRARYGLREALRTSARPKHSEHQLGTALDLRSVESNKPAWDYLDWGGTAAGAWLGLHSWEYGFVISYPNGRTSATCYAYEPWHVRYVGRDLAAAVQESGLTLREYLWANDETKPVTSPTACCFLAIF
ncbi:MAG: M15 family metallopeptidase [Candidatus Limnocylindrales bacterium]